MLHLLTSNSNKVKISKYLANMKMGFDIELTSKCNAKCIMCPRDKIVRENWSMDKDHCIRLADNIAGFYKKYKRYMGDITFCGMGDNLLNPFLIETMEYLIKKYNYKNKFTLVTNAISLSESLACDLKKIINLKLIISYHGTTDEEYKAITGVSTDKVLPNIRNAIDKGLDISITCVGLKNFIEKNEIISFWKENYGLNASISAPHSRGNHIKDNNLFEAKISPLDERIKCKVFRKLNFISSDGNVLSCCHDIKQENIIGNVFNNPLEEIVLKKIILYTGDRLLPFNICKTCDQIL